MQINILYILIIVYLINVHFLYRFQRVTLGIARSIGNIRLQAELTPNWITVLYLLNFILLLILPVLIFLKFGCILTIIFLLYTFIGIPIFNVFIPILFPSYNLCFRLIKNGLVNKINKENNIINKIGFEDLLQLVIDEESKMKQKRQV
jgi:hypothetical protein